MEAKDAPRPGRRVEGYHLYALFLLELLLRHRPPARGPYKLYRLLRDWIMPAVANYFSSGSAEDPGEVPFEAFLSRLRELGAPHLQCVADWFERSIKGKFDRANIPFTPTRLTTREVVDILQEIEEHGGRARVPELTESLARKYAALLDGAGIDDHWREAINELRARWRPGSRPTLTLFCAAIPPHFLLVLELTRRLCNDEDEHEQEWRSMSFLPFWALITDCREGKYGRIWQPPQDPATFTADDSLQDPTRVLLDDIDLQKWGSCARARLRISRHFPKTVELLDTWLAQGLDDDIPGFTYRFGYGEEARLGTLVSCLENNPELALQIKDMVEQLHRSVARRIQEAVGGTMRQDGGSP